MEVISKVLESAMKGEWDEVVEAYATHPIAREAKISKSGDTALHIAVADGQRDIVLKLVEIMGDNASKVLRIVNKRGNTALHLAAALGNADICHCMAQKAPELITSRNSEGETPLFMAVHAGKKAAFLCLRLLNQEKDACLCRKNTGESILQSAISGEYFSLAYQIICDYPDLINSIDENGQSPLHILAGKPSAFKSSSYLELFDHFIYNCLDVDHELWKEKNCHHEVYSSNNAAAKSSLDHSENYRSSKCLNLFGLIRSWSWTQVLAKSRGRADDEENPQRRSISQGAIIKEASSSATELESEDRAQESSDAQKVSNTGLDPSTELEKAQKSLRPTCALFVQFFKLMMNALLNILKLGIWRIRVIEENKVKHRWANLIMNKLVQLSALYKCNGENPQNFREDICGRDQIGTVEEYSSTSRKEKTQQSGKEETPLLIAARMGVSEMVEKILSKCPEAIHEVNSDRKNVVLLAVENRQIQVYKLLLNCKRSLMESAFQQVDNQGNNALHLAAMFGNYQAFSLISGAALQMQWETKWYKFVKKSMPPNSFARCNNNLGKTPKEVFKDTHKKLVKDGSKWLAKTSESCSVMLVVITSFAFSASSIVPGGLDQVSGKPLLQDDLAFNIFAISSMVALCFSITALLIFLTILTSRFQEKEFSKDLPRNLLIALLSMFISVVSILISFCSGHFLVLKDELRSSAYTLYAGTCLPMLYFALAQLPLYYDLALGIFKTVPQRGYKVFSH